MNRCQFNKQAACGTAAFVVREWLPFPRSESHDRHSYSIEGVKDIRTTNNFTDGRTRRFAIGGTSDDLLTDDRAFF